MKYPHKRFRIIQEECRRQGKPTYGTEFLNIAEALNESLKGSNTEAAKQVKMLILKSRIYAKQTRQ
jgi:translation initiation factor 2 beta subunit (eIF-2beta)/eIF-5